MGHVPVARKLSRHSSKPRAPKIDTVARQSAVTTAFWTLRYMRRSRGNFPHDRHQRPLQRLNSNVEAKPVPSMTPFPWPAEDPMPFDPLIGLLP